MPCQIVYEDMMSLKLDRLLDAEDERRLDEHLSGCADCMAVWTLMQEADSLLWASAQEPLPVPIALHATVMARIAVPVLSSKEETESLFRPEALPVPVAIAPPSPTRRLDGAPTGYLPGTVAEWQRRLGTYLRGAAAALVAVVGMLGLLLALTMSGTIPVSGPVADAVGVVRTFFQAIDTWARSLVVNSGPGLFAAGGVLLAILVLVGWQVVAAYHRTALESRGATGALA